VKDVKCVECGFLAIRDEYDNSTCEAPPESRQRGIHKSSHGNITPAKFFCYKNCPVFDAPVMPSGRDRNMHSPRTENETLKSINNEIDCDLFFTWRPGKSPKEHEEMMLLQEVERRTDQWRQDDLRWQKQQEALAETRHQELKNVYSRQLRVSKWQVILAGLAIVGGIVAGVLSGWLSGRSKPNVSAPQQHQVANPPVS
jgi:hypothetical protein